jgi:hypothetical protein
MNGRMRRWLHEKTSAAAAPRKPKNGAVSSPLNIDDIFLLLLLRCRNSGSSRAAAYYSSSTPRPLELRALI